MKNKKVGRPKNEYTPDLIKMGIIPRKLTRKEAKQIVSEVMDSGLKDADLRFMLAVSKTISVTNQTPQP